MSKKGIEITIDEAWVDEQIKEEREAKTRWDEVMDGVDDTPEAVMNALMANFGKIFKENP